MKDPGNEVELLDEANLPTIFIFVSCEEKGYYRVVSVGQLF